MATVARQFGATDDVSEEFAESTFAIEHALATVGNRTTDCNVATPLLKFLLRLRKKRYRSLEHYCFFGFSLGESRQTMTFESKSSSNNRDPVGAISKPLICWIIDHVIPGVCCLMIFSCTSTNIRTTWTQCKIALRSVSCRKSHRV